MLTHDAPGSFRERNIGFAAPSISNRRGSSCQALFHEPIGMSLCRSPFVSATAYRYFSSAPPQRRAFPTRQQSRRTRGRGCMWCLTGRARRTRTPTRLGETAISDCVAGTLRLFPRAATTFGTTERRLLLRRGRANQRRRSLIGRRPSEFKDVINRRTHGRVNGLGRRAKLPADRA
jgi:hypothetical protein